MKTLILALALILGWVATARADMESEMLSPSVIISNGIGNGSGTAIKVDPIIGTYILTNWHVMSSDKNGMRVQFYGEEETHPAYLHSVDVQNDIAVIITPHIHHSVAKIGKPPDVFDEVYCIGASYGMPLAPSKGIITGLNATVFGTRFMTRMDCNVAPGNSGGGLYAQQDGVWVLVGIPSAVRMVNTGMVKVPVSFLGLSVRIEDVVNHLHRNGVIRALPPPFTPKQPS